MIEDYDEYWRERRRNLNPPRPGVGVKEKPRENSKEETNSSSSFYFRHSGEIWERNRQKAKERDDFKCVDCGLTDEEHAENDRLFGDGLHIHHKTPAKEFDDKKEAHKLENLITVCADCHRERENS